MNEFDYKKATQAINFFACADGGKINKIKLVKLIYFADKYHLRKYGRTLFNDQYFAMPRGPVASSVKDIAEFSDYLADTERSYAEGFVVPAENSDDVFSRSGVDESVFSKTDLEALSFAWNTFGAYSPEALVEVTHMYPEWKKFKSQLDAKEITRAQMDYEDFFQEPEGAAQEDKLSMDAGIVETSKDAFEEHGRATRALA